MPLPTPHPCWPLKPLAPEEKQSEGQRTFLRKWRKSKKKKKQTYASRQLCSVPLSRDSLVSNRHDILLASDVSWDGTVDLVTSQLRVSEAWHAHTGPAQGLPSGMQDGRRAPWPLKFEQRTLVPDNEPSCQICRSSCGHFFPRQWFSDLRVCLWDSPAEIVTL